MKVYDFDLAFPAMVIDDFAARDADSIKKEIEWHLNGMFNQSYDDAEMLRQFWRMMDASYAYFRFHLKEFNEREDGRIADQWMDANEYRQLFQHEKDSLARNKSA